MFSENNLLLENIKFSQNPFPHFSSDKILDEKLAHQLLNWFKITDHWHFTQTSFYTQYEFSLLDLDVPVELRQLSASEFIQGLKIFFKDQFNTGELKLVGITAHKLVDGYRMGVHNDFIGKDETHRLIVQLNDNWTEDNGGFLMLFNSKDPHDVAKIIKPVHNSGIGFEISTKSYHAVSTVHSFERYTLVYTFSSF